MTDWPAAIRKASENADQSQTKLRETIAAARGDGESWQAIGSALGVSRQAAQQRFKDVE